MSSLIERLVKNSKVVVVDGESFEIQRMTVADRDAIKRRMEWLQSEANFSEENATILATIGSTCSQDGDKVFEKMSLDELKQLPYSFVADLFMLTADYNKMGASNVEESKENFTKTP